MTDLHSYRADPDAEFANRLERELLGRLTDPAVSTPTELALVTDVREAEEEVTRFDVERADGRRRPWRIRLVVGGLTAAGLVAVLALAGRNSREGEPTDALPAANGLIAISGDPADGTQPSDVTVVAPDGSRLRALTSTPALAEDLATWSPDGSRLAFVRRPVIPNTVSDSFLGPVSPLCTNACLVIVDPSTGGETFSVELPRVAGGQFQVPSALAWSPDGNQVVVILHNCGQGGCGGGDGGSSSIFRREQRRGSDRRRGSPSGLPTAVGCIWSSSVIRWCWCRQRWSALATCSTPIALPGVRVLRAPEGAQFGDVSGWTPDGSGLFVETGIVRPSDGAWKAGGGNVWIDVISIADGQRRTVIEDGFDAGVSPDGSKVAFARADAPGDLEPGDLREDLGRDHGRQRRTARDDVVDAADVVTGRSPHPCERRSGMVHGAT